MKNLTNYQKDIILSIKKLRECNGISQTKMCNILMVSSELIGNIESPKYNNKYSLIHIFKFCQHIQYPFERIFLTENEINEDNHTQLLIERIIEYE